VNGRKRHLVVDTEGNVLAVAVDTAALSDVEGGAWVLERARGRWPELAYGWADQAYRGVVDWAHETSGSTVQIVERPAEARGFVLLPRRWVVERSLAWTGRARRLSKEYEHHADHTETVVYLASCWRLLQALAPSATRERPYLRKTG
jgi:transposase